MGKDKDNLLFPEKKIMGKPEFRKKFIMLFFLYYFIAIICWVGIFYGRHVESEDIYFYSLYLFIACSLIIGIPASNLFIKRSRDIFPQKKKFFFKRLGWNILGVSPIFSIYYFYELFTRDGYSLKQEIIPVNNYGRQYLKGITTCFLFSIISTNLLNYVFYKNIDHPIGNSAIAVLNPSNRYVADISFTAYQYFDIKEIDCKDVEFCRIQKAQKFAKSKSIMSVDNILMSAIAMSEISNYKKQRKPASFKTSKEKQAFEIKMFKKMLSSLKFANSNIHPEKVALKYWLNGTLLANAAIEIPLLLYMELGTSNELKNKYHKMTTDFLKAYLSKDIENESLEYKQFKTEAKRMLASIEAEKEKSRTSIHYNANPHIKRGLFAIK